MKHQISRNLHFCIILMVSWLCVSCRSLPPSPTPVALPTATLVTTTPTPLPTVTRIPPLLTVTDEVTPSPDEIITFITTTVQPQLYDTYASLNGVWQVKVEIYDCTQVVEAIDGYVTENAYEQMTLVNLRDGIEQIIDSQFLHCGGLGAAGLAGLFWSSNNEYFYFTDAREGVPDGCGFWAQPIHRLEVQTMKVEQFGGGSRSPHGTRYATWLDKQILLWDIELGELDRWSAQMPNAQPGPIVWSPDGQSLVYIQLESGCPFTGKSYVSHIDLTSGEQNLLLESETPTFGTAIWETEDRLTLFDSQSNKWLYDWGTGTLKPMH